MAATEELRVLIRTVADTSGAQQAQRAVAETQERVGAAAQITSRALAGAGIAGAFALRASEALSDKLRELVGLLGESVQAAREHERAIRATGMAYGAAAHDYQQFAVDLSRTTGFTSDAILEAALSARTLSQNYGLTIQQTQKLITVSADLARVRGIGIAEAFERVQSAIRGEAEASEYLGLTLNDTYLKNQAMNGSLKNTYETMTDTQKAQVRYNELLKQSQQFAGLATSSNQSLDASFNKAATAAHNLEVAIGNFGKGPAMAGLDALTKLANIFQEGFAGEDPGARRFRYFLDELTKPSSSAVGAAQAAQARLDADRERARQDRELQRLRDLNTNLPGAGARGAVYLTDAQRARFARDQARSNRLGALNDTGQLGTDNAAALAQIAYMDQLTTAVHALSDAYAEQNRIERESVQLNAALARAQLAALPATERLAEVQSRIQRDQILLRMRGLSPEERRNARLEIRNLSRNVLPGAELAALDAELAQRPAEQALARNRLAAAIAAGATGGAQATVEHVVSGSVEVNITGDLANLVLTTEQQQQVGQAVVDMFHQARLAADNAASKRLTGAQ